MRIPLLFLLFLSSVNVFSQSQKNSLKKGLAFLQNDTLHRKQGLFALPLLYYTPDTRWAAGMAGVFYFNTGHTDSSLDTRLSYMKLLGDYTQNKQTDIWAEWNIFTNHESFLTKGEFRYRNFPDKFYGIGNQSLSSNLEAYTYDLIKFKLLGMKQIKPHWFVGFDYQFEKEYGFELDPKGVLLNSNILGNQGGIGSALGGLITYDSRDNVINAYSGKLFEFSTYSNHRKLGSTFHYTNVNLEYRQYYEWKKNHIFAFQALVNLNFGEVPFLDMARLGSDGILRGYPANRFRDHHMIGLQAETRFPIHKRLGMVVFAGAGDVFYSLHDLSLKNIKFSIGSGLRFVFNTAERLNLRLDYGVGKNSTSYYFLLTESF
ncbi:MAG: BamA/TamA family outer membrane protein [Crocinitomicaceae bacterium]